jgi:branched-chain amino acid transport system permease protein
LIAVLTTSNILSSEIIILLTFSMALPLRAGLLSVSPAAFAGVGAYAYALCTTHWTMNSSEAILVSVLVCAAGSAFISLPLSRIRGVYTSVATLALVVVCTSIESSLSITGGSLGLYGIPYSDMRWTLAIAILVVMVGFIWLDYGKFGRHMDLLAGDRVLAEIQGVSAVRMRVETLVISSAIAGFAGAMQAHSFYVVTPNEFDFFFGIQLTAYAVVGGPNYWFGPLASGVLFSILAITLVGLPILGQVITGLVMVLVIVLYPEGIGGVMRRQLRRRVKVPRVS